MGDSERKDPYDLLCNMLLLPKNRVSIEILRILYLPEEAEILSAGPFKTAQADKFTVEEYSIRAGIEVEKVKETFGRLSRKGLLFWVYDRKNNGKKKYMIPQFFPGLVEYYIISPHNGIDERRKFIKKFIKLEESSLVPRFMDLNFSLFRIIPPLNLSGKERTVAIAKDINVNVNQIYAYQEVEQIVRRYGKYDKNIAVMPCTCRTRAMMLKESPKCKAPVESCIALGDSARYIAEEGIGRYVSMDECFDILKRSEEAGSIHLSANTIEKQGFICNCCPCCCGIVKTAIRMNFRNIFQKSDYMPVIDFASCNGCKICVDLCCFNALIFKMGEKENDYKDRIILRPDICVGCGICESNCPRNAISLKMVRNNLPANSMEEAFIRSFEKASQ